MDWILQVRGNIAQLLNDARVRRVQIGRGVDDRFNTRLTIGLLSLFSKKRKHFLTIGFKDDAEKDQVAVMELGKDIVRNTLAIVQTCSGKLIEYQDEEARKSAQ